MNLATIDLNYSLQAIAESSTHILDIGHFIDFHYFSTKAFMSLIFLWQAP